MKSKLSTQKTSSPKGIERVRRARGERIRSQRGSSLVELAIVIPFLVLLALGAIDFGRAFYLSIEVANAARAGAQYGVKNPSDVPGMKLAAQNDAHDVLNLDPPVATWGCECSDGSASVANCASPPTCPGGSSSPIYLVDYVQVNTSAAYRPIIAWPGIPVSVPMSGQAKMRLEQ